jgi:PAS domain S-box-containing protein
MENLPRLYNSRIIKLFTTYLQSHYPYVDLAPILRESRITQIEIDDPGHWFNQAQVDLFYQKVVEATGNTAISREVGRTCVSADAAGAVKQHILGLLNISSIYLLMAKLYPMLSRGASLKARKLAANKVEIVVTANPGVQEKPYQCENRTGFFEALATMFSEKYATVVHDECLHHGAPHCRYEIFWEEPGHRRWCRYFWLGVWTTAVLAPVAVLTLPMVAWPLVVAVGTAGLMGICLRARELERQELVHTIQRQGNAAEDHIKEIDFRYRGLLLVQKIGQTTSELLDLKQLTQVVMENIQRYLDFDRGMILLADPTGRRLSFMAGYGFDEEKSDILKKTSFRLDNPEAKGIFIQVFKEQTPRLVDDVLALQDALSERSRIFVEQIGAKSLLCLPIVYENQSLGILAVDNFKGKRSLNQSDMNLLLGVAYQTAVSIFSVLANKKLQESEERYRSLYDSAPVAYFSISPDNGAIVNCNLAATRLLGYSRTQLLGSSWLDHFAGDHGNRARAQWIYQALQRGQAIHNEEIKLARKTGQTVCANLSLEPFRNAQGQVLEGRCVLIDVTESKQLEEKLRKSQRLEAMGTLAGGVAHDLSNILSAIVSYPDLLLMDIGPDNSLFEPLNKIKAAGTRATAIVHDLLTLARLGLQYTEVIDINTIVTDFIKSPECDNVLANHPLLRIKTDLNSHLNAVRGSGVHLIKTLMNIVINAAEAMPAGGEVLIRTRNQANAPAGKAPASEAGPYVVLTVKDNGIGIAKEDLEHIFEPFFTKKVMGRSGTGLGMAIVWATVQEHKGHIEIESEVGKGTAVSLFFPATKEVRIQTGSAPDINDIMGRGETILLVDDEDEHRDIAAQMLTRLGYAVTVASSAQEAIEHITQTPPNLLVLDMVMGTDMDGLSIYRRILSIRPRQKALIVSGFSETARVKEALELGAGAFLNKPYGMKEIALAVRQVLEGKS